MATSGVPPTNIHVQGKNIQQHSHESHSTAENYESNTEKNYVAKVHGTSQTEVGGDYSRWLEKEYEQLIEKNLYAHHHSNLFTSVEGSYIEMVGDSRRSLIGGMKLENVVGLSVTLITGMKVENVLGPSGKLYLINSEESTFKALTGAQMVETWEKQVKKFSGPLLLVGVASTLIVSDSVQQNSGVVKENYLKELQQAMESAEIETQKFKAAPNGEFHINGGAPTGQGGIKLLFREEGMDFGASINVIF